MIKQDDLFRPSWSNAQVSTDVRILNGESDAQRAMYAHFRAIGVNRYHAVRTIKDETIAAHVGTMLGLAYLIHDEPSPRLLKAIAFHDHSEFRTGDSPSDEKARRPALKAQLDIAEDEVTAEWNIPGVPDMTGQERRELKVLDVLSGIMFCFSEFQFGNRHHVSVMRNYVNYFHSLVSLPREMDAYTAILGCLEPRTVEELIATLK